MSLRSALGRRGFGGPGCRSAPAALAALESPVLHALIGAAVRAEVWGAAPSPGAWRILEQRIGAEAERAAWSAPRAPHPGPAARPLVPAFSAVFLPRCSQVGSALLMLLLWFAVATATPHPAAFLPPAGTFAAPVAHLAPVLPPARQPDAPRYW